MGNRLSKSEIATSTTWEDTGYDCDHCGGRILKRIDRETGLADRSCFQCEQCSCQWTMQHQPLRVGRTPACRAAQRQRAADADPMEPYSRWLLIALAAVLLLGLLRFGGGAMFRVAVPAAAAAAAVFFVMHVGRRRGWW